MKKKAKKNNKILRNKKGQGMLEYVMLLAVVAVVIVSFRSKFTGFIDKLTGQVESQASQAIGQ